MKLLIACIGRASRGPERDLYEHYANRIRWPLELRELEEKRKLPTAQMILREGELLLGAVPAKSVLVALDRRGKPWGHAPPPGEDGAHQGGQDHLRRERAGGDNAGADGGPGGDALETGRTHNGRGARKVARARERGFGGVAGGLGSRRRLS